MAIGEMDPVLVIAVDNCGVPKKVVEHIAARLLEKKGLRRERFVVCSTHTHNAPSLRDYAPILSADRTPEAQELRIDQYKQWLQNRCKPPCPRRCSMERVWLSNGRAR